MMSSRSYNLDASPASPFFLTKNICLLLYQAFRDIGDLLHTHQNALLEAKIIGDRVLTQW